MTYSKKILNDMCLRWNAGTLARRTKEKQVLRQQCPRDEDYKVEASGVACRTSVVQHWILYTPCFTEARVRSQEALVL